MSKICCYSISGDENASLLRFEAASNGKYLTTVRNFFNIVELNAAKMQKMSSFAISVPIDHSTWCNISEDLSIQYYGRLFVM